MLEIRLWKAQGLTHAVYNRRWYSYDVPMQTCVTTECDIKYPNVPWRITQRFSLQRIDCMACMSALVER